MRRLRRLFVMLFVVSTLLGAMHEIIHHHHHDMDGHAESCPIYLLTQTIAVPTEAYQLPSLALGYEPFTLNLYLYPSIRSSPRAAVHLLLLNLLSY